LEGYDNLEVKLVPIDLIDRPETIARLEIDAVELEELRASIREQGLHYPLLLNVVGERYEIVAGDRRYLAIKGLGWPDIPAKCKVMSREEVLLIRATENLQRKDLSPIEEGLEYSRMIDVLGISIEEVARKLGKGPGHVKRRLDLLRMPDSFQRALHAKSIAVSTAEELWSCPDEVYREYLLEMSVEHGVTRDVARMWVQDYKKSLRSSPHAGEGSPLERGITENQPIFRACDCCRGPVDMSKLKELRICPGCFRFIVEALQSE
jgi:ParB family chromosome partitioning protein